MAISRFAGSGRGSNFISAGKTGANEASKLFQQVTANSPDYGGMAQAWQAAESSKAIAGIKAQTQVVQQGIASAAGVRATELKSDAKLAKDKMEIKTKMAGKLAAYGGTLAKSFTDKREKPLPPAQVDTAKVKDLMEDVYGKPTTEPEAKPAPQNEPAPAEASDPQPRLVPAETPKPEPAAAPAPQSSPVALASPTASRKITFDDVYTYAQNSGAQFPGLVAAQWQLETGGTSGQGPTANNNIFAQKGGNFVADTMEHVDGQMQSAPGEGWKSYDSPQAATDFLVDNWYKDSAKHGQGAESLGGGTREGTARQLNALGYATDPEYADKLLRILQDRGL